MAGYFLDIKIKNLKNVYKQWLTPTTDLRAKTGMSLIESLVNEESQS